MQYTATAAKGVRSSSPFPARRLAVNTNKRNRPMHRPTFRLTSRKVLGALALAALLPAASWLRPRAAR